LLIQKRPYYLLLFTALAFIFISLFVANNTNGVDIQFHDTYYILALTHFFWLLAIIALLVWTLYLLTNRILFSKVLTWTHVILTIFTLAFFASPLFFAGSLGKSATPHFYDYNSWHSLTTNSTFTNAIAIAILVLLSGQIIFIINVIAGLFKRQS
jgi:hypothetical protein